MTPIFPIYAAILDKACPSLQEIRLIRAEKDNNADRSDEIKTVMTEFVAGVPKLEKCFLGAKRYRGITGEWSAT